MIVVDVARARAEAEAELATLGFAKNPNGSGWVGGLDDSGSRLLQVLLPAGFPYELPIVLVDRGRLDRQVPHVEITGKVCIAAASGLMVDPTQSTGLVREAVERARRIVSAGLRGEHDNDLVLEFSAYWSNTGGDILSFCAPRGQPRPIAAGEIGESGRPGLVIADNRKQLRTLAARIGVRFGTIETGYFVPLAAASRPPGFNDATLVQEVLAWLSGLAAVDRRRIEAWTSEGQKRLTIAFSFPTADTTGDVVFAARLRSSLPAAMNGYRTGNVPILLAATTKRDEPIDRVCVQRADPDFLRRRTGSPLDLRSKSALVIGCGAIGGYLAVNLGDAGFGKLTLIDKDDLRAENAMRHVIGLHGIGQPKVNALKAHIQGKLPHVDVEPHRMPIEELLDDPLRAIAGHAVVLLATGDHSLELLVSERVRRDCRLVHVWIEAHGVGGHVLVDGGADPGCLGCLFHHDDVGLTCRAALCAPGQPFTSSIDGCAGTFTPFGSIDAQRAAIEATRAALRVATDAVTSSTLTTWFESEEPFRRGTLRKSERAAHLRVGERVDVSEHAGCPRCTSLPACS